MVRSSGGGVLRRMGKAYGLVLIEERPFSDSFFFWRSIFGDGSEQKCDHFRDA